MRGSRVQAVVNELQGEKVDIIQWNPDAASFIVNGLAPAEVTKVVLDEDSNRIEVVVPESQLSLAIGRRGQNVRLASQLTGWDIDIVTEQEESERRQKEFSERSNMLMEALDVDEVIAQLLVTEGFASIEEVAFVDLSEIAHIEGFDEHTANEIQTRAREYLEKQEADRDAKRRELGVADEIAQVKGVTTSMMVAMGENGVKTLEDLADCATDDLVGWTERKKEKDAEAVRHKGVLEGFDIGRKEAEEMIMSARVLAGWIKAEDLEQPAEEAAEEGEEGRRLAEEPAEGGNDAADRRRLVGDGRDERNIGLGAEQQPLEDADDGDARGSLRRCIVTRSELPPDDLIRFVADPSGTIVPDVARKLPGRGVWVTAERSAVEAAVKATRSPRASSGK